MGGSLRGTKKSPSAHTARLEGWPFLPRLTELEPGL